MKWGWVHRRAIRVLRIIAGGFLVLLGIVGIIMPVMPGWVFVWLGIVLLLPGSWAAKWPKTMLRRIAAKCPQLARRFQPVSCQDAAGPERAVEGQTVQHADPGRKDAPAA